MNEMNPETLLESANFTIDFFERIFAKIESVKAKKLSMKNYLRAYYFEVLNNIELLNVVNMTKLKDIKVNSDLFRLLITKLETQMGAAILFDDEIREGNEIFRFLQSQGKIHNTKNMIVKYSNGKEEKANTKSIYENILQAISFTIVKIEILRKLSGFSEEQLELINHILLERRIVNIKERFIMIKNKLEGIKDLKELSR